MVTNVDVVPALERIADMLEIRGENTFTARAEYAVFRNDDGTHIAGKTEEDVSAALGLPWMPPPRRDDPAEIDAAPVPVATEV
jgi:DNA polymerase/3'-5' exonuclease PolX